MTEIEIIKTQVDAGCGCKFEVWYDVMCPGMTVFRKSEVKFLCLHHDMEAREWLNTHLMLKCDYYTTLQRKKEQIKDGRESEDHNWLK